MHQYSSQIADASVREAVVKILKPDPKFADFIEVECSRDSWKRNYNQRRYRNVEAACFSLNYKGREMSPVNMVPNLCGPILTKSGNL
ncbi:Indole-3-acetic acid-amido synthetase GH3.6 [Morella rubra]|uniref:Indole-3-acetic acid-amido synthetase GH3.6 n=1 Tax=Morella rubra TaxID=262757 RepID=A0A6A1WIR8_9ROSI|nr:Indole-3-acetic acid-amido synthetase GH3.6 [Morella rubra]